jgi:hypothetical protein
VVRAAGSWKAYVPRQRQPRKALQYIIQTVAAAEARELSKEIAVKKQPRGDPKKGAVARVIT